MSATSLVECNDDLWILNGSLAPVVLRPKLNGFRLISISMIIPNCYPSLQNPAMGRDGATDSCGIMLPRMTQNVPDEVCHVVVVTRSIRFLRESTIIDCIFHLRPNYRPKLNTPSCSKEPDVCLLTPGDIVVPPVGVEAYLRLRIVVVLCPSCRIGPVHRLFCMKIRLQATSHVFSPNELPLPTHLPCI